MRRPISRPSRLGGKRGSDFVQVHYSIHTRQAEERIFPAAADHGTAVSINMPLEKARLHAIVQGRPLPDFAKELEIENWSAFFLKWVTISSRTWLRWQGPLPDKKMRARMVRHMETIPGFDKIADGLVPGQNIPGRHQSRSGGASQTSMRSSGSRRRPD